ncbi:MAG: hypothetical protein JSV44_09490, partial [Candidatus Zixiibacteriota bacterium]
MKKVTAILALSLLIVFGSFILAVAANNSITNVKPNDESEHQDEYVPLVGEPSDPDVDQPNEAEQQRLDGIIDYPIWQSLSAVRPEKPEYDGPPHVPGSGKLGGETIATATVIGALPYVDTDNTCDYVNDYDEVCPYSGSTAPDVVYSYAPAANETVDISLCYAGTDYDTKLYVYENSHTPGSPYACNDDACPGYVSEILELALTGGNVYYIVVDGYGSSCGNYELHVDPFEECVVECPGGASVEGEACIPDDGEDVTNGGCNNDPPIFSSITCGETVCGTCNTYVYGTSNYRDTDWYELVLTENTQVTVTIEAEFPALAGFAEYATGTEGSGDCANTTGYFLSGYANVGPCEVGNADFILTPGTWFLAVMPSVFEGVECDKDYVVTVNCAEVIGRCCYGDPEAPSCDDLNEPDCLALSGNWDPDKNCTDDPCPVVGPGDNCDDPIYMTLPADLPYDDLSQYTCGRYDDYPASATCYGLYGNGEDIIYEVTVTEDTYIQITIDPKGTTWTYCELALDCPPNDACLFYFRNTGGGIYSSECEYVPAGTYYLMIDTWPSPYCIEDFDLHIEACSPPVGRCCYGDPQAPSCDDIPEAACLALGGMWDETLTCATDPCPISNPGDNCADPIVVKLPDDLDFVDENYTCDRLNNYSSTCLGSYDGGEDIIYALDVDGNIAINLTLDPRGTTWTGMAIADECPPGATCLAYQTNGSSSSPFTIENVELSTGMYYVMIDTWPSPACIPDFELTITEYTPCVVECPGGATPEGEDCIPDDGDDVTNGGCNN